MTIDQEFEDLDDLAMLLEQGSAVPDSYTIPKFAHFGPALEAVQLSAGEGMTHRFTPIRQVVPSQLDRLLGATDVLAEPPKWNSLQPLASEVSRVPSVSRDFPGDVRWIAFCKRFDLAARDAGCSKDQGFALTAAMRELVNNVWDHSGSAHSCVIGYQVQPGQFEFAVADLGVGVLASLRSFPLYAALPDHSDALRALLSGATSRGPSGNAGYRAVFRVLEKIAGFIRCRSGDACLRLNEPLNLGKPPRIDQRPNLNGVLVSVSVTP